MCSVTQLYADQLPGSPLYCNGDYTYSDFGNIADCCTQDGVCHPATDCGTDSEGSTRAIEFQGGETLTWYGSPCVQETQLMRGSFDTTCGTQTIYKTEGDSKPISIFGCFDAGELYLTTPGKFSSPNFKTILLNYSRLSSIGICLKFRCPFKLRAILSNNQLLLPVFQRKCLACQ
jgi:hypothetical protein